MPWLGLFFLWRHKQRLAALSDVRHCRSDIHGRGLGFALVFFDNAAHKRQMTFGYCVRDLLFEICNALLVDSFSTGQFQFSNLLSGSAFNGAKHASLTRRNEQNSIPGSSRSTGTSNAVDVCFGIVGYVVVDNVTDAVHIQASSGYICCHQNV